MLTETITIGLERYRIGPKLRALRLQKKLGLAELASHTGLSTALLSKLERGQNFPTLPTLLRIALVFGVGLEHFFTENADDPLFEIVRKTDRLRLPETPGDKSPAYLFESLNYAVNKRPMDAYLAAFPPGAGPSKPHSHSGAEFLYVVSGTLSLTAAGREVILESGDAVHFDSSVSHHYVQHHVEGCTALVVTLSA